MDFERAIPFYPLLSPFIPFYPLFIHKNLTCLCSSLISFLIIYTITTAASIVGDYECKDKGKTIIIDIFPFWGTVSGKSERFRERCQSVKVSKSI